MKNNNCIIFTVIINRYLQSELGTAAASEERRSGLTTACIEDLKEETQFTFIGW